MVVGAAVCMESLKILGKGQSHMFGTQFKQEVFIPLPLLCVCVCVCMCLCVCVCDICTVTGVVFRHTGGIHYADLIFEEEMIFWQDRALPHFYIAVWDTMDESKVSVEMDWHGPPCPPDLTALDFFFGYIKNALYMPPFPNTSPDLAGMIQAAVTTVTPIILTDV